MAAVTTSLVVNFGGGAKGILLAELDNRPTGYNNGITAFIPTDTAYFLVYATSNVAHNPITFGSSYGFPVKVGSGSEVITELVTFTGTNTASSSKPIKSGFSSVWLGKTMGSVSVFDENSIVVTPPANAGILAGALQITYTTTFDVYSIASPATMAGLTDFVIVVVINGTSSVLPL